MEIASLWVKLSAGCIHHQSLTLILFRLRSPICMGADGGGRGMGFRCVNICKILSVVPDTL